MWLLNMKYCNNNNNNGNNKNSNNDNKNPEWKIAEEVQNSKSFVKQLFVRHWKHAFILILELV